MRLAALVVALLLPLVSFAQDESLAVDNDLNDPTWSLGAASCGGTACSSTNCALNINEVPTSPDNLIVATETDADTMELTFPPLAANPSEAADAQAFEVTLSKCRNCEENPTGADPNYDLVLFCGGTEKLTVVSAQTITGNDVNATHTWTFTDDVDCDADGGNVEITVRSNPVGSGGNKRHICIEAVEWEVTHVAAGGARRMWVTGD